MGAAFTRSLINMRNKIGPRTEPCGTTNTHIASRTSVYNICHSLLFFHHKFENLTKNLL